MSARKAHVFGTGLLGASVGLGLRAGGWWVGGWDPKASALDEALARGAIEAPLSAPVTDDADLIVLAAPPAAVIATLEDIRTDALVTDIAGVKMPIVSAASHLPHFVGGHPMAGGETSGPSLASSSMFHGATWVLTSDGTSPEDVSSLAGIVESLGANAVVMTAEEHDSAVARVSHLPHLLAAVLMRLAVTDPASLELAGGGFRDLTRIAAGESGWWAEVLRANADQVRASIGELEEALEDWRATLDHATGESLVTRLDQARRARLGLGEHHTQVKVVLLDKPGEIARVGHALELSRVDVRDFQLRHGEHGGGGILTISVKGERSQALADALADDGFEVGIED